MPEQSLAETLQCPIEVLPLTDIYAALGTQPQGLTHAEAAARLQHYGRNARLCGCHGLPCSWRLRASGAGKPCKAGCTMAQRSCNLKGLAIQA
jgi:hypothetical protein